MVSLFILTILFLFLLSNNFKSIIDKEEILISNLVTSLLLSISFIGLVSICLVFTKLTYIPILFLISLIVILYVFLNKLNYQNLDNFGFNLKLIYKLFSSNFKNYRWIIFLIFWLYFISFGPINHPDTITTYLGYPYQFFQQNKHFIDGGLHQGLLGLCDFANLSFLQERNTWFIRSVQSIPIVLIVSIFILRKKNKLLIYSFLTCPVFIQWLTIGKYLFLLMGRIFDYSF